MIYNSRYLLDPTALYNMTSNVNANLDRAIERERRRREELNKYLNQGVKAFAGGAGKAIDEGMKVSKENEEREARNSYVRDMLQGNDPVSRAAADEYIRTGNANPILQRQMQLETMKAREAEKQAREIENSRKQEYNRIIEQTQLKPVYMEAVKKMNDAIDAGNFEDAEIFRSQANAISAKAGTNWGMDLDQVSEARTKTKKAAMEKQAEEERLARQQANIDKEYEDKSYNVKNWIYENIIPVGKIEKKEDQIDIANFIRNPRLNLTEADRKELLDRVYRDETQQESLRKAGQEASVKKTGEKVEKSIDEAENRAQAMKYVGKKINKLQWDVIPDEQKKYLSRDVQGNVSEKK